MPASELLDSGQAFSPPLTTKRIISGLWPRANMALDRPVDC